MFLQPSRLQLITIAPTFRETEKVKQNENAQKLFYIERAEDNPKNKFKKRNQII